MANLHITASNVAGYQATSETAFPPTFASLTRHFQNFYQGLSYSCPK